MLTATIACLALALAGCSEVVDGQQTGSTAAPAAPGAPAPSGASSSPDFPSAPAPVPTPTPRSSLPATRTAPAPVNVSRCPKVRYPAAHLQFTCILPGLKPSFDGPVWPLTESKILDKAMWAMAQGAGAAKRDSTVELAPLTTAVTHEMIAAGSYGSGVKAKKLTNKAITVDGNPAHLLETRMTLDPSYAKSIGTKVRTERLWVVSIRVSKTSVSLWFVTIPDIVKKYWSKVPKLIKSITVI